MRSTDLLRNQDSDVTRGESRTYIVDRKGEIGEKSTSRVNTCVTVRDPGEEYDSIRGAFCPVELHAAPD